MRVGKGFKFTPQQYESKSFFIELSHEELGLSDPRSVAAVRETAAQLSREVEALVLVEQVKLGRVHPNQIHESLKPWLPPTNTT